MAWKNSDALAAVSALLNTACLSASCGNLKPDLDKNRHSPWHVKWSGCHPSLNTSSSATLSAACRVKTRTALFISHLKVTKCQTLALPFSCSTSIFWTCLIEFSNTQRSHCITGTGLLSSLKPFNKFLAHCSHFGN